jgi:hypothetical protein
MIELNLASIQLILFNEGSCRDTERRSDASVHVLPVHIFQFGNQPVPRSRSLPGNCSSKITSTDFLRGERFDSLSAYTPNSLTISSCACSGVISPARSRRSILLMRRNDFVNSSGKRSSITNRVKAEATIAMATILSTAPTEPRSAIEQSPMIHQPVTPAYLKAVLLPRRSRRQPQHHNEGFWSALFDGHAHCLFVDEPRGHTKPAV